MIYTLLTSLEGNILSAWINEVMKIWNLTLNQDSGAYLIS